MIRAITFDLDGVYFLEGKEAFINALVNKGIARDEAIRVFLKSDEMNNQYKTGKLSNEQFWSWAAHQWKSDITPVQLMTMLIDGYRVNKDLQSTLASLRASGYKTLICSNNFPARIEGLQRRFNFLKDFDAVVLSYELGVTKPSQAIFQELIHRSGVPAESIVYTDDKDENVTAAQTAGLCALRYIDFATFVDDLRELGVSI